jgi:RNA methyltransferase, TrmH family
LLRRSSDRADERVLVLEGPRAVVDALDAGVELEAVYLRAGVELPESLTGRLDDAIVRPLADGVIEQVSDTVTPQGIVAVAHWDRFSLDVDLGDFVLVGVDIGDPGNAGTIVRSAEAAGASAVVFAGASVDVSNPKVVRSAAGALFHLAVVDWENPIDVLERVGGLGMRRLGAVADGGTPCDRVDLTRPVALVVGNEAHGLPAGLPLDGEITIPMAGRADSFNVGMAAAILCYETARQRRAASSEVGGR